MSKEKVLNAFAKLTEVVKAQFGEVLETPEVVTEQFMSVKTVEGVVVNLEGELAVGTKATIVLPDGTNAPAPEGEHTLEDGTKIMIKEGAIAVITPAQAEVEVEQPMQTEQENFTAKFDTLNQALTSLVSRIEALEGKNNPATFASVEDVASLKDVTSKMYTVLEGLIGTPSAEPVAKPEVFSASNKRAEKIKELSNLLNSK